MGCSVSKVTNQPSMVKEPPPIATQKRPWPFGYDKVSDYSSDDGSKHLPRKEYGDCTSKEGNDDNKNNNYQAVEDGDLDCDDGSPHHHPGSPSFRFYIRSPSLKRRDSKMEGSSTVKRDSKRGSRSSISTTVMRPSIKFVGVDDDLGKLNNLEQQHPTPSNNKMETKDGSTRTSTATRLPGAAKFAAFRTYVVNVATCRTTLSQTDAAPPHHQPCQAK